MPKTALSNMFLAAAVAASLSPGGAWARSGGGSSSAPAPAAPRAASPAPSPSPVQRSFPAESTTRSAVPATPVAPSVPASPGFSRPPSSSAEPAAGIPPSVQPGFGFSKPPSATAPAALTPPVQPSSGFSKPSLAAATPTADSTPSAQPSPGFGKPGSSATTAASAAPAPAPAPKLSAADAQVSRTLSGGSLAQYEKDKNRSSIPATPVDGRAFAGSNPAYAQAGNDYHDMNTYYRARQDALRSMPPPPSYVQQMAPNYGMMDGLMLGMLLSNMSRPGYADWASANRDNPDFRRWRQDADRLSADNADMRRQLADMDARMATANPGSVAKGALPPGMSPALAIAPEAMMQHPSVAGNLAKEGHGWLWTIMWTVIILGVLTGGGLFAWRKVRMRQLVTAAQNG